MTHQHRCHRIVGFRSATRIAGLAAALLVVFFVRAGTSQTEAGEPASSVTVPDTKSPKTIPRAPGTLKTPKTPQKSRKDLVGALFPIPLGSRKERLAARRLYERALKAVQWQYVYLDRVRDPLAKFRISKNPKQIPDPRRGGRGNNTSDHLTNLLLGWLLYDDQRSLDAAVAIALWLAEIPDEQDHGHIQRHPAIGLAAVGARDGATRAKLLSAFLASYSRLQNSRFFVDDPKNREWMIGMAGVRPFLRAVGAAHRFVHVLNGLFNAGHLRKSQVAWQNFKFKDSDEFLERVQGRLVQFCTWRKTLGDDQKRGWQTEPGDWLKEKDVTLWPYLSERVPRGEHVTWFHVGCLWPYEMLIVETHWGRLASIVQARTAEIASWALEIGFDGGHLQMTGLNIRSQRGTFRPDNPELHRPFRRQPRARRLQGESAYSVASALYYADVDDKKKKREIRRHFQTTKCTTFRGEVTWAGLLVLDTYNRRVR